MSPQGPQGEVYSTHTTVSNFTWHYVVGVQLSAPFDVTPQMLGIETEGAQARTMVQFQWSDATTFKLSKSQAPTPFSLQSPVALATSPKNTPTQRQGRRPPLGTVDEYNAQPQYHTLAPVFESGWVFLGEAQKLVPISRQRVSSIMPSDADGIVVHLVGMPGENVEVGAYHSTQGSRYAVCSLDADGLATYKAVSNSC
jgi:hypothetical protein